MLKEVKVVLSWQILKQSFNNPWFLPSALAQSICLGMRCVSWGGGWGPCFNCVICTFWLITSSVPGIHQYFSWQNNYRFDPSVHFYFNFNRTYFRGKWEKKQTCLHTSLIHHFKLESLDWISKNKFIIKSLVFNKFKVKDNQHFLYLSFQAIFFIRSHLISIFKLILSKMDFMYVSHRIS